MNVPKIRFYGFKEEWQENKLCDIAKITMGQSPNSENYTNDSNDTLLIQGNADLNNGKVIPRLFTKQITKTCDKNDIIMTVRAPVGDIAISDYNACIGRGVCSIKSSKFVYHYLDYLKMKDYWKKISKGSTIDSITSDDIKSLLIKTPNKKEEEKIIKTIDLINKKIELQSKKIEDLKLFKMCTLDRFFNKNSHETKNVLSNYCTCLTGKSKANQVDEKGIYYIMDMGTVNSDGYILKNKPTFCNLDMLSYGDLIMPKDDIGGGLIIGKTGFIDENNKYILGDHVYLIKTKNINSLYLHYQINSKYINKQLKRKVTGSAQLGLKADNILNQEILVHSKHEQNKIANIFKSMDKKIMLENKKLENLLKMKKGLMQNMFV